MQTHATDGETGPEALSVTTVQDAGSCGTNVPPDQRCSSNRNKPVARERAWVALFWGGWSEAGLVRTRARNVLWLPRRRLRKQGSESQGIPERISPVLLDFASRPD